MIIVTTPICENILKLAGITNYKVNKHPDEEEGDLAILLSESKVKMDSLPIKLNTFNQIRESIVKVSSLSENPISQEKLDEIFENYDFSYNLGQKVNVYSEFLKDLAIDLGLIIDENDYEYVIFPDYLKNKVNEESNKKLIEIPTHSNVPKDPLERCKLRYEIIVNYIMIDVINYNNHCK